ncbi:MAG TPA: hypothetical protein PKK84_06270, partial [Armatimonadota bacterium]|nr:hypothetical protein [Armatimonadota bacterium]
GVILRTTTGGMTPGDVDCDGEVGIADAALALRFASGLRAPSGMETALADLAEPTGVITIADAAAIAHAL